MITPDDTDLIKAALRHKGVYGSILDCYTGVQDGTPERVEVRLSFKSPLPDVWRRIFQALSK